jgi:hypothetical protein
LAPATTAGNAGADSGQLVPEYAAIVAAARQYVGGQRAALLARANQAKALVTGQSDAEKASLAQTVGTQSTKMRQLHQDAIQQMRQTTASKREEVANAQVTHTTATQGGVTAEQTRLHGVGRSTQAQVTQQATQAATTTRTIGQQQAQQARSMGAENANAALAQAQAGGQVAGADAAQQAQARSSTAGAGNRVASDLHAHGERVAAATTRDAETFANTFTQEAGQATAQFGSTVAEGSSQLQALATRTVQDLSAAARQTIQQFEQAEAQAIATLTESQQLALSGLQHLLGDVTAEIDHATHGVIGEIDAQSTQVLADFDANVPPTLDQIAAMPPEDGRAALDELRSQVDHAVAEFGNQMAKTEGNTQTSVRDLTHQADRRAAQQVSDTGQPIQRAQGQFNEQIASAAAKTTSGMGEAATKAQSGARETTSRLESDLSTTSGQFGGRWTGLAGQGQAQLEQRTADAQRRESNAVGEFGRGVSSATASISLRDVGRLLYNIGASILGLLWGIIAQIGQILFGILEFIVLLDEGNPYAWLMTLGVVVLVIVGVAFPPVGVALLIIADVIGIVLSGKAAWDNLKKAFTDPNLTWFERFTLIGRALVDIALIVLLVGGLLKAIGRLGGGARRLGELGGETAEAARLARLRELAGGEERLRAVLARPGMTLADLEFFLIDKGLTIGEVETILNVERVTVANLRATLEGDAEAVAKLRAMLARRPVSLRSILGEQLYDEYEAAIKAIKAEHPDLAGIPTDDLIAIRGWTGEDYARLNRALRFQNVLDLIELEPFIDRVVTGLRQLPSHVGKVTRAEALGAAERWPIGQVTQSGFTGASIGQPPAQLGGGANIIIQSKTGKNISRISRHGGENEVLFLPGTRFEVTEHKFGGVIIEAAEL